MKNILLMISLILSICFAQTIAQTTGGAGSANDVKAPGLLEVATFKLTTSPTNEYVLTSDASGNASWQEAVAGGDFTNVDEIRFVPREQKALVTFVFDDAHETNYTVMKPLFDGQGEVACAAITTDYIGGGSKLSTAQITELEGAGWEILSHSKAHSDFTTITEDSLRVELLSSLTTLRGLGHTVNNFVYPFGKSSETIRRITREYYDSARGTWVMLNPYILNTFRLNSIAADDHTELATFQTFVDDAESELKWLIFHLHQTDGDDATAMGTLIDYIQGKSIPIVTINQGLALVGNMIDVGDNFALGQKGIRIDLLNSDLIVAGSIEVNDAAGGAILNEAATTTNPTLIPNKVDDDTGIGKATAGDILVLIAGGVEAVRYTESGGDISMSLNLKELNYGRTILGTLDDGTVTDANVHTIYTYDLSTAGEVATLEIVTVGRRPNTNVANSYKIIGTFKNVTGTVTQIGSTAPIYSVEESAVTDPDFNINGTDVEFQIYGLGAYTQNWVTSYKIVYR